MSRKVGVWIDHRQAIIVALEGDGAEVETVRSSLGKRVRMAGGWRTRTPWGPQDIASESRRDRHHDKHLHEYYEDVLTRVGRASSVFVLGPGEAKQELIAALARSPRHRDTSTEMEAVDKLTERQIVARVKAHFGP